MRPLAQTPSQTVGPFFHEGLVRGGEEILLRPGVRGTPIRIIGRVLDGAGAPVPDAVVEIWQADAAGIYRHRADPRSAQADPNFTGFGRCATREPDGAYAFETIKPGRTPDAPGAAESGPTVAGAQAAQAPHLLVHLFGRGLLTHLSTRLYFADEAAANAADPVLSRVEAARRPALIATRTDEPAPDGRPTYRLDFILQGPGESVFFQP
jgi:protocatechuate 3,4-dioxygenase alpha subunit